MQIIDPFDQPAVASGGIIDPFDSAPAPAPAEPKVKRDGWLGTIQSGVESAGRAIGATFDAITGDNESIVERADAAKNVEKDAALTAFYDDIAASRKQLGEDPGLWDSAKAVTGAMWRNKEGAAKAIVEQLPNSAAALGGGWAGMKAGAAAGTVVAPGLGTAIGAIGGGLAGMFAGNAALEIGNKAIESAQDGVVTDEERTGAIQEGAVKAGVITGVDAVTLGASKWITGATARAMEAATRRTLVDAGVDVTSRTAVEAARKSPEITAAVRRSQEEAAKLVSTAGQKALRYGGAGALETLGEGTGEYLGELAATGKADMLDAVLESALSAPQSAAEIAWGVSRNDAEAREKLWDVAEQPEQPTLALPNMGGAVQYVFPDGSTTTDPEAARRFIETLPADQRDAAYEQLLRGKWQRPADIKATLELPGAEQADPFADLPEITTGPRTAEQRLAGITQDAEAVREKMRKERDLLRLVGDSKLNAELDRADERDAIARAAGQDVPLENQMQAAARRAVEREESAAAQRNTITGTIQLPDPLETRAPEAEPAQRPDMAAEFERARQAEEARKAAELEQLAQESRLPAAEFDAERGNRIAEAAGIGEQQPTAIELAMKRAQGAQPSAAPQTAQGMAQLREADRAMAQRLLNAKRGPSGTVTESAADIDAQVAAYAEGKRGPVFVDGEVSASQAPEGMSVVPSEFGGSYIVRNEDADAIAQIEQQAGDKEIARQQILGYTQSKPDAMAGGNPVVVQARNEQGQVVKQELVDGNDAQAIQAAQESQAQAGAVELTTPDAVLNERTEQQQNAAKSPARKGPVPRGEAKSLLELVRRAGGIAKRLESDIAGEPTVRRKGYPVGVFREGGMGEDMLAELMQQNGYITEADVMGSDSGAEVAFELMRSALAGERVVPIAERERMMAEAEEKAYRDGIRQEAREAGIKVVGRKFSDLENDVLALRERQAQAKLDALEADERAYYDAVLRDVAGSGIMDEGEIESLIERNMNAPLRELAQLLEDAYQARLAEINAELSEARAPRELNEEEYQNAVERENADAGREADARAARARDEAGRREADQRQAAPDAAAGREGFQLESQTERELKDRIAALEQAEAQRKRDEEAAERRRQADAERDSFTLTGSDRPADVLAAQGQGGLFDRPTQAPTASAQSRSAPNQRSESAQPVTVTAQRRVRTENGMVVEVDLSNGKMVRMQRLNGVEGMGLAGWHDIDNASVTSYLGDTKDMAIEEILRSENRDRSSAVDAKPVGPYETESVARMTAEYLSKKDGIARRTVERDGAFWVEQGGAAAAPQAARGKPISKLLHGKLDMDEVSMSRIGSEPLNDAQIERVGDALEAIVAALPGLEPLVRSIRWFGTYPQSRPLAQFWQRARVITASADSIAGDQQLLQEYLAHELHHAMDFDPASGLSYSASQPQLFGIETDGDGKITRMGVLLAEAIDAYERNDNAISAILRYPFGELAAKVKTAEGQKWVQTELFAELGRIYMAHRELMAQEMPLAHQFLKAIHDDSIHDFAGLARVFGLDPAVQGAVRGGAGRGASENAGAAGAQSVDQADQAGAGDGRDSRGADRAGAAGRSDRRAGDPEQDAHRGRSYRGIRETLEDAARANQGGSLESARLFQRGLGRPGSRLGIQAQVEAVFELTEASKREVQEVFTHAPLYELQAGAESAAAFHSAISAAHDASPFGAAVYVYDQADYEGMRLFVTQDGLAGFALKQDGDIVSVFKHPDSREKRVAVAMIRLAIEQGGRKLDAFDTELPFIYAANGMRVVARMNWNDEYAPGGWDKQLFAEFNSGEPDVVFMTFDPAGEFYSRGDGQLFDDYDLAVDAQSGAIGARESRSESAAAISNSVSANTDKVRRLRQRAEAILGQDSALVRFAEQLLSRLDGQPISGRYTEGQLRGAIEVALNSRNPMAALNHESFHHALASFFTPAQARVIKLAFAPGGALAARVKKQLRLDGETAVLADRDYLDAEELSAFGFQYYAAGRLKFGGEVGRIFKAMADTLERVRNWIRGAGFNTVEDLFAALDKGRLANHGRQAQGSRQRESRAGDPYADFYADMMPDRPVQEAERMVTGQLNGKLALANGNVALINPRKTSNLHGFHADGDSFMSFELFDRSKREIVGYVELEMAGSKPVALHDIYVADSYRRGGAAANAVGMLLTNDPQGTFTIVEVLESARGFWESIGTSVGFDGNGQITWNQFYEAREARRAGRESRVGTDGQNQAQADVRNGARQVQGAADDRAGLRQPGGNRADRNGRRDRMAVEAERAGLGQSRESRAGQGRQAGSNNSAAQQQSRTAPRSIVERARQSIKWLDSILNPLGNMADQRAYLIERYKTMGAIAKWEEIGKQIYDTLKKADTADAKATFTYLTTKGATPDGIKNAEVRAKAVEVKAIIDKVGQALVKRGLISQASYEKYRDQYLPRMYLRYLLDDSINPFAATGAGRKTSNLGYTKERKELPAEVREVLLGEVTDPAFLSATGIVRAMRDLFLLHWLEQISQNEKWILPKGTVEWNGQRVTPHWLKKEAEQLRKQADYYDNPDNERKARKVAREMDEVADAAFEAMGQQDVNIEDYKQMPDTARYGRLRGLWVRSEIYDDIMGVAGMNPDDSNWVSSLFGYGGIGTKVTQAFKTMKVTLNPASQVRNFVSNMVLLQLSGVPLHRIPGLIRKAVNEMANGGRHYQVAKKYGITESSFSSQELFRMKKELLDLEERMHGLSPWGKVRKMAGVIVDFAGEKYQKVEELGKVIKIIDSMEREQLSEADAVLEAQKWLFDYSLVPAWMRYARNAPIGAPFLTFTMKVLPRLMETATTHPQRFLPWVGLWFGLAALSAASLGYDEDEMKAARESLPEWAREKSHVAILPFRDEDGRIDYIDLGYHFPWTMWVELAQNAVEGNPKGMLQAMGALSGPIPDLLIVARTGIDPFTGQEVWNEAEPESVRWGKTLGYFFNMAVPPWLATNGPLAKLGNLDETDKFGDARTSIGQAIGQAVGFPYRKFDPQKSRAQNLQVMQYELSEAERALERRLRSMQRATPEERREVIDEYVEHIRDMAKELQDYAKRSQMPARPASQP